MTAIFAAMAGLGILAWKLHEAKEDTLRLQRQVVNLSTLARAAMLNHTFTKNRLADASYDKLVLHRFLDAAGDAERDLKDDLNDLRNKKDEVELSSENMAKAWVAQDTALKSALATESNQRQQAEQTAAQFQSEAQRLAGEATNLQQYAERLRAENQAMSGDISRQRSQIGSLESENSSLRSCNAQLQNETSSLRSTICSLEARISCLQNEICHLRGHHH